MAFEYGSIDLGIRNPFRIEGIVRAASGAFILILGVTSLFSVQGAVQQGDRGAAASLAIIGVFLTGWALKKIAAGLFQVFRFFAGRRVPADLAENLESNQAGSRKQDLGYTASDLEKMLKARVNTTFREPQDWLSRLVHSVFQRLLFLPWVYRNMAQSLARAVAQALVVMLCYSLTWLSAYTGLTNLAGTPVLSWLAVLLGLYLLGVWAAVGMPLGRVLNEDLAARSGSGSLTLWISLAILVPVALSFWHTEISSLPQVAPGMVGRILLILLLGGISTTLFGILLTARSKIADPKVEVSEYRENWQESIHPGQIFIHFDTIVMANRRYEEVPNRVYRALDPIPMERGGTDKGEFQGQTIQETQPIFRPLPESKTLKTLRMVATAGGAALTLLTALMIYLSAEMIARLITAPRSLRHRMFLLGAPGVRRQ